MAENYMTGEQMLQAVEVTSALVVGGSTAETIVQLGGTLQGSGLTEIVTFPLPYGRWEPVSLEAAYASQMWDYFKVSAEAAGITSLGSAAMAAKAWGQGVLFGDPALAGSLAGSGGLLTMSLPVAAAAMAPLMGVSLGATLYSSNPELWTKISRALLPFCYEDTQAMPFVVDKNGQAYVYKDALDALKHLFDEERIGETTGGEVDTTGTGLNSPLTWVEVDEGFQYEGYVLVRDGGSGPIRLARSGNNWWAASLQPSSLRFYNPTTHGHGVGFATTISYTKDGRTCYAKSGSANYNIYFIPNSAGQTVSSNDISWYLIYGNSSETGGYPEGTSKWEGQTVDPSTLPTIPVVTKLDGSTEPYYPITIPIGDPGISADPEIQPDPTAPVTAPEIEPYIKPEIDPQTQWPEELPLPSPDELVSPGVKDDPLYIPTPDLDPSIDPSAEPQADPEPAPEPDPPPPSAGVTPPIIFPLPDVQWPTIIPVTGSGLVHVYNPTPAEFVNFGHWLWVTYADPSIQKLWNNPFDGVIGAHELYATPSVDGRDTIKSGFLDSGIQSNLVRVRYNSINCGSIVVPEYWRNYLDYSPYSKAYCYLPFIGIVELDVDDIVGHAVNILYHVDAYNGSCIAQITVAKDGYENTVYQFSGNCAVDLPMAGGSQAAIRAGMISAAAYGIGSTINGVVGGAMHGGLLGGVVGGAMGAVSGAANGIANIVSQKSTVQHSGSFGASYGAMGIKKPYIVIRRPIQKTVARYNDDYGYPAHKRVVVGDCEGYLRVREVHVLSSLATDEEKIKIEELLKSGVFIND